MLTSEELPLHLKYRPKTLEEVIGHKSVVKAIENALELGRVHSFLFTGPSGVGKTTLARIIARSLCDGEPTAQNLIEINGADQTGVEAARDVVRSLRLRALGASPTKIVIYDEVHKVSNSAWSSLLKPIEEPPSHVYWCLCTTEAGKIPKTIKSRCLHIDLKPLKDDDIIELLEYVCEQEELETIEEVIDIIAESAEGSPRQALVNLELCMFCENASQARKELQKAGESEPVISLARLLIGRQGRTWDKAVKIVKEMENTIEPESVRIIIVRYFTQALLKTKKDKEAIRLLTIMECFSEPYAQTDGFGPLLLSLGEALGLND